MLEVVLAAGVVHQCVKLKDEPTTQWREACNGLWDRDRGSSCDHEEPKGDKQLRCMKKKLMDDVIPAFGNECDLDMNNNVNPLPSFVMAKNLQDAHVSMLKAHDDMKNDKEEKGKI